MSAKSKDPYVDEDLLRAFADRSMIKGSVAPAAAEEVAGAEPGTEPRKRRVVLAEYEPTFLRRVIIDNRSGIYLSRQTKDKLSRIVSHIGDGKITVSGYVENVVLHHLETYREEINQMYHNRPTPDSLV